MLTILLYAHMHNSAIWDNLALQWHSDNRQKRSMCVQASPTVVYVGGCVHNFVAKVPYLQWFVQPFDEAVKGRHLL